MLCMTYDYERFTKWLRGEMKKRDWSQAELARQMQIDRATVNNVLKNDQKRARGAGPEFCRQAARAFGYPPDEVFRIAGLLPNDTEEKQKRSPLKRVIISLIDKLPTEQDDIEVEEYIRLRLRMAEKRSGNEPGSKKRPSES